MALFNTFIGYTYFIRHKRNSYPEPYEWVSVKLFTFNKESYEPQEKHIPKENKTVIISPWSMQYCVIVEYLSYMYPDGSWMHDITPTLWKYLP